jgi:hypothetical protein
MGVRPVKAVRLLGQDLVLFRMPTAASACWTATARTAAPTWPSAATRATACAAPSTAGSSTPTAAAPTPRPSPRAARCASACAAQLPAAGESRRAVRLVGARRRVAAALPRRSTALPRRPRTALPSRACGTATGCRPSRWASTRRMRRSCTASSSTSRSKKATAASSAAPAWARSTASAWPMTKVMREFDQPDISFELPTALWPAAHLAAAHQRPITHVRVTNAIFPHTFVIPLSETMTITQMHVPVDDTNTYWYASSPASTSRWTRRTMRNQRLEAVTLPDYMPKSGQHNDWGFSPMSSAAAPTWAWARATSTCTTSGPCESMGAIQDRTREHLGTTDKVIMANRRCCSRRSRRCRPAARRRAWPIRKSPRHRMGPDTVDGIAPTGGWRPGGATPCRPSATTRPGCALKPVAEPLAPEYSPHEEASFIREFCGVHDAAREGLRVAHRPPDRGQRPGAGALRLVRPARRAARQDADGQGGREGAARGRRHGQHAAAERHLRPHGLQGVRARRHGRAAGLCVRQQPDAAARPGQLQAAALGAGHGWLRCQPWFQDGTPVPLDTRRILQLALGGWRSRASAWSAGWRSSSTSTASRTTHGPDLDPSRPPGRACRRRSA